MRFSLQDIKKSVQRRKGQLAVSLHFLHSRELQDEITRLVAYYEQFLGCPQRQFSLDEARACIGDYRLAHCLIATLSNWYSWRQREWTEVIQQGETIPDLPMLSSPIHLRLALYDYVNEHYHGFLDTQTRQEALQTFAALYQLRVPDLEYLLALDTEDEAVLVREEPEPPTPQAVTMLYNQWAFEAALFTASSVRFVIDCNAFGIKSSSVDSQDTSSVVSTGVGAIIKRLSYMARKLGVYYDLAYEPALPGLAPLLTLTLYGPQEVTGTPQQYGLRLARLCRMLLGYGIAKNEQGQAKRSKKASLSGAIVEAEATVHFLQRSYTFTMDTHVLQFVGIQSTTPDPSVSPLSDISVAPLSDDVRKSSPLVPTEFDSSIEQAFTEAFMALASSQGVDGWRLEREPEPLLLEHSLFIPDFALTRSPYRIYVEILGFWTPSYRERKVQKLQQLQDRNDLLLAIPIEAKDAYSSIVPYFPTVFYNGQLSATDVVTVLRNQYDDFSQRLAAIDGATVQAVQAMVRREGLLSERACYSLLCCYRRSELQRAAEKVVSDDIVFAPGLGLYDSVWMNQLKQEFMAWIETRSSLPLGDVLKEMRIRWPVLVECEDASLETLLSMWSDIIVIQRSSIFDAVVSSINNGDAMAPKPDIAETLEMLSTKPVKKQVREKRSALKKRIGSEGEIQGDLWG